ncbi:hypothetical protein niasHS_014603 [Heterodera schachtii]|uniref:Uncharacterized protein n=1 Tax=Heterodera schachtii TaxID=97005 RepID=A0ABD2IMW0_HETSC
MRLFHAFAGDSPVNKQFLLFVIFLCFVATAAVGPTRRRAIRNAPREATADEATPKCDLGDIELNSEEFVHTCDEDKFENANIYCKGKLLEARKSGLNAIRESWNISEMRFEN